VCSSDLDVDYACQLALRTLGRSLRDAPLVEKVNIRLLNHPAKARWNLNRDEVDLRLLTVIRLSEIRIGIIFWEMAHIIFGN
jgi:hypothetical protein